MKDRMHNKDWMETMVKSTVSKLKLQLSMGKSLEESIKIVKDQTCSGSKVWEEALKRI